MFVRREVLTKLKGPWFHVPDYARRRHLLWGASEDFAFCDRARAAGFRVWTNGDLLCSHLHTVDLAAVAQALVVRRQEDLALLERMGIRMPTIRPVA